ncbi:hypothetical protein C8A03DRAFT_47554 [Achaetomium macrosporum]|uniref:Uncharacterized protein n=1 Tax=Achaetomium macrosporum TaxID=79813 RepID=A0AAN7C3D6_9PEZI|nr:hypothetical protein C8A03DRAFT_47554 [Achaetomium macrosporum]
MYRTFFIIGLGTKPVTTISASLTAAQKTRLHEVADLLLSIMHTLACMRYLQQDWIQPGPHNIDAQLPLYHSLGLDPSIIYLYSILHYLSQRYVDFFQGSSFADFRTESDVRDGRKSMHDSDTAAAHMRPWMTPLSMLGNHDSVILYDAKRHVIGIFDQIWGRSSDPNLYEGWVCESELDDGSRYLFKKVEEGRKVQCEAWELKEQMKRDQEEEEEGVDVDNEAKEDEDEEDEEDEDEDEGADVEKNYWDEMESRPAPNNSAGWEWDPELVTPVYRKHGWPSDSFDGDAFQVDQVRAVARARAEDIAQRPLAAVQTAEHYVKRQQEQEASVMPPRLARLAVAATVDEEWTVRWEIWQAERHTEDLRKKLKQAQETTERLCPNKQGPGDEELLLLELKEIQINLRVGQCTTSIGECEEEVAALRAWMGGLPDGAELAKRVAQGVVDARLDAIAHLVERRQGRIDRVEKLRESSA